jgi:hypothetical protein
MADARGAFYEAALRGMVARDKVKELVADKLGVMCEPTLFRPSVRVREAVYRPKPVAAWSAHEVAAWLETRMHKDVAAQVVPMRLDGPALASLVRREECLRRGVAQSIADVLVAGVLRLLEETRQAAGNEVRVRTQGDRMPTLVRWTSRPTTVEKVRVDTRTVSQVEVASGDAAAFLESAGFALAFEFVREGPVYCHSSGVTVSVFDLRKVQQRATRATEEVLAPVDPTHAVVELRMNASMHTLQQASDYLLSFAASLAPIEFYRV